MRALLQKLSVYRLETHYVTSILKRRICIKEYSVANIAISALNFGRFLLKTTKRSSVLVFTKLTVLLT